MDPILQKKHEELYKMLLDIYKKDNDFTFYLTTRNEYRFNRGDTGYTNVGIVTIGSRSNHQLFGFHFTNDFSVCELKIAKRNDDIDINTIIKRAQKKQKITLDPQLVNKFIDYFTDYLSNTKFTNYSPFDSQLSDWIHDKYWNFFNEVKKYDNNNTTSFYDLLKISTSDFTKNKTISDNKFRNPSANNLTEDNGNSKGKGSATTPNTIKIPLNQILYGPPGTGKTYHTVEKSLEIVDPNSISTIKKQESDPAKVFKLFKDKFDYYRNQGQIVFTTFHQSMSYEDFVEGIKPIPQKNGGMTYDVKSGIFKQLCEEAEKKENKEKKYVLVIDEINRGNVSQIFGELITLLEKDKRLGQEFELKVKLPYSNYDFGVPSNLYIIGTMNTADRSVEALDTALRRRFSFVEMMPKPDLIKDKDIDGIKYSEILTTINKRIVVLKDREHQIGHSYFMNDCNSADELKAVFQKKIVPLLQEYFYGNYENIRLVLGDSFVTKKNEIVKFAVVSNSDSIEQLQYSLLTEGELNISEAIRKLLGKPSKTDENNQLEETTE